MAHSSIRCWFFFIVRDTAVSISQLYSTQCPNAAFCNVQVRSRSPQEWPDEVLCHPNNVLTMNGFLSFWLHDIMTLHTLNYRHTLLPLLPAQGKKKKKRDSPGHGKKEGKRLSVGEEAGEVRSAHIWWLMPGFSIPLFFYVLLSTDVCVCVFDSIV